MMSRAIRQAVPEDAAAITPRLRESDVKEVRAMVHVPIELAVRSSILGSREPLAIVDGGVQVLWGIAGLLSGVGAPWMVATPYFEAHPVAMSRIARRYFAVASDGYERLENRIDARNDLALKWIRWLGFDVDKAEPWGPDGLPFHRFRREVR